VAKIGGGAFISGEGVQQFADAGPERIDLALGGFAQERFQFGEQELDRIEIGRLRRQVAQLGTNRFDCLSHAGCLVRFEVIHNDDVAARQGRGQALANISQEDHPVHRLSITNGAVTAPATKVLIFQCPCGTRPTNRFAPRRAAAASYHVGGGAGLVGEPQPRRIKRKLILSPALSPRPHPAVPVRWRAGFF
jgi:hypothetical protein